MRFFNHEWNNPAALQRIGVIPAEEIHELSGGLFSMDVPVEINKLVFDYDQVIIVGPVFPHEVVGFSGGNKYLFPGISGPELLNFFHWLGAVITTPKSHRQQMDAGPQSGGPRRRDVEGRQAMRGDGRASGQVAGRTFHWLAGRGLGPGERTLTSASHHL